MLSVIEAGFEVIGDGDRVVAIGEFLKRESHQHPTQGHTQDLSKDNPQRVDAHRVAHARKPEQQPGALAGGVRAERDDPGGELLVGDVVARDAVRLAAAPHPDREKDDQVHGQDGDDRCGDHAPTPRR